MKRIIVFITLFFTVSSSLFAQKKGVDMLTIKTETSELRLYIEGSKNDEVILFLSGGSGVPDYLQDVSVILNKKYKTVKFDQRGVS